MDAVDLVMGPNPMQAAETRTRLKRVALSLLWFALGHACALLYWLTGFWCLAVAVQSALARR